MKMTETTLFNHVIVVADDNSAVTYVENYISTATPEEAIFNIVSEVFTGANARVTYGAVDNLAEGVTVYVNRRGMANGRDSKIEWALGLMNDGDTVSENITNLWATVHLVIQNQLLLDAGIKRKTSQQASSTSVKTLKGIS